MPKTKPDPKDALIEKLIKALIKMDLPTSSRYRERYSDAIDAYQKYKSTQPPENELGLPYKESETNNQIINDVQGAEIIYCSDRTHRVGLVKRRAYIVLACNMHEELVVALRNAYRDLLMLDIGGRELVLFDFDIIGALLAKANGVSDAKE